MSTSHSLTRAVQCALAVVVASTAYPTFAQERAAEQAKTPVEEVIVTGTRIVSPNMVSTSPIQVITSQEIRQQGRSDMSDVLNQLPQNFSNPQGASSFSNRSSGLTTAGGISTADLRGLGPQRTLVLVNGRRLGPGSPNTAVPAAGADLSQIPTALVERVDVVTGGASAVYGSDAISGVINFVMKRNFEGLQVDYQLGENWHNNHNDTAQRLFEEFTGEDADSGSVTDGRNVNVSLIAGTNFADGRGNITAYFGYLQADPISSGARDFGACQADMKPTLDGLACTGTGNSNRWQVGSSGPQFAVVGNDFLPWNTVPGAVPPAQFNSQRYIAISRDDQRYIAGFMAHMELNEYVEPYVEFGFMNDQTNQVIAPSGLFEGGNVLDPTGNGEYFINCGNPFLSAQQRGIMGCTGDPNQLVGMTIGRRNIEGKDRETFFEHDNYRAVVGAKGEFARAFSYDAYGQYYYTSLYTNNTGYLNLQNVANALIATIDPATGQPACVTGAGTGCVPWNIFQQGGVTQDQLNYMYASGSAKGDITEQILHGDITVDLGEYNIRIPTANEGIAFNIGYERRSQDFEYEPDFAQLSGLLSGFGGASVAIDERYVVNEQFIEARIPILEDKPGAQYLAFDAGYRRSDYTTIGVVNTEKFEVQYAPIEDVRLRGSYQKAIRAPSLTELFTPQLVGKITFGEDPCAPAELTGALAATLEECVRTGVTPDQYNNRSVPQGTASQLSQLQGGNSDLTEETAKSYTFGVTFTPRNLPDFSGSLDYYQIKVEDEVSTLPAAIIMSNCLSTGDPTFCGEIDRLPNGSLNGSTITGGFIRQTNVNIGEAEARGIDVQAAYRLPIADMGSLVFSLAGSYLLDLKTTPIPGGGTYDCAGLFGFTCQTVNPEWRHNLRIAWNTPWNVDVSLLWRYLDRVKLDNNDSNALLFGSSYGDATTYDTHIGSYNYFDLFASWRVRDQLSVRAGMNNIFDKDPPLIANDIVGGGSPNTYETYDTLGRQWFVGFTAKFGPAEAR